MRKKTKIIHLLCHLPALDYAQSGNPEEYILNENYGKYHTLDYPPYWVGFFIDHNVYAAQDLLALTDEFELECWRPYGYGLKEIHEEIVNRIRHKVFPAHRYTIPQFGSMTWSNSLYKELVREIHSNNIILNISVGHAWFHIRLMLKLSKLKSRFALVAVHRSGGFRCISFQQMPWWKRVFKWYYHIEAYIDRASLKYSDVYYLGAQPEYLFLKKKQSLIPAEFITEGIDFSKYRCLSDAEKIVLRSELGLPHDKNLFIVYGNWRSNDYGYGPLISVYKAIKESGHAENLQLVMIGGYKSQDLFQPAIEAGAIMVERCSKERFINYLEASDFFGQPIFSFGGVNFGGFGISMVEALACGMPVISNNIFHFPGTQEELKELGVDMPTPEKLREGIIYLNENFRNYTKTREIAMKYHDLNHTRMTLLNKYRELEKKYFDNEHE